MSDLTGILPASGKAERLRGLPKFLLPSNAEYETLLEFHVDNMLEVCSQVLVPTRPEYSGIVNRLLEGRRSVTTLALETSTMSETVIRAAELVKTTRLIVGMPDTFFFGGGGSYRELAELPGSAGAVVWKIREEQKGKLGQVLLNDSLDKMLEVQDKNPDCDFDHHWGLMRFNLEDVDFLEESSPHVGYLLPHLISKYGPVPIAVASGNYYDCGTPEEFLSMIHAGKQD